MSGLKILTLNEKDIIRAQYEVGV